MTPEKDQVFQFRLSSRELAMLRECAESEQTTAGDFLRAVIREAHALRPSSLKVIPPGLDEDGKLAWKIVSAFAKRHRAADDVRTFSPRQWARRGHEYGTDPSAKLIVVHEGTDFDQLIDDRWNAVVLPELVRDLEKAHMHIERYVGFVALSRTPRRTPETTKRKRQKRE